MESMLIDTDLCLRLCNKVEAVYPPQIRDTAYICHVLAGGAVEMIGGLQHNVNASVYSGLRLAS